MPEDEQLDENVKRGVALEEEEGDEADTDTSDDEGEDDDAD